MIVGKQVLVLPQTVELIGVQLRKIYRVDIIGAGICSLRFDAQVAPCLVKINRRCRVQQVQFSERVWDYN